MASVRNLSDRLQRFEKVAVVIAVSLQVQTLYLVFANYHGTVALDRLLGRSGSKEGNREAKADC